MMMEKHGIYVQDINYPTVPRGEEKLRIAPTPHHTDDMRKALIDALIDTWNELGLYDNKPLESFNDIHVPVAIQA